MKKILTVNTNDNNIVITTLTFQTLNGKDFLQTIMNLDPILSTIPPNHQVIVYSKRKYRKEKK